jgi:hypothetical protein
MTPRPATHEKILEFLTRINGKTEARIAFKASAANSTLETNPKYPGSNVQNMAFTKGSIILFAC